MPVWFHSERCWRTVFNLSGLSDISVWPPVFGIALREVAAIFNGVSVVLVIAMRRSGAPSSRIPRGYQDARGRELNLRMSRTPTKLALKLRDERDARYAPIARRMNTRFNGLVRSTAAIPRSRVRRTTGLLVLNNRSNPSVIASIVRLSGRRAR